MAEHDEETRYWLEQVQATAANPDGWGFVAETLKTGADELLAVHQRSLEEWRQLFAQARPESPAETFAEIQLGPFLVPVYLMLAGLALENLAKAIGVSRKPELAEPNSQGKIANLGHIRRSLFARLEIDLADDEAELVDRLEPFVRWAGRYPTPLSAQELAGQRSFVIPCDPAAIDALFARLQAELQAVRPHHAERMERERIERGLAAYARLSMLPTTEAGGVVQFIQEDELSEAGSWTTCLSCGKSFSLAPRTPAALCGCGNFHYGWEWYDGSLNRFLFRTDALRESEIPLNG